MKRLPVLCLLLWLCALFYAGIYLFVSGFLLVRLEVNRTSGCDDVLQPSGARRDFCGAEPRFRRTLLLVIDALKIDFARFDPDNKSPRPYENKLPVLEETASRRPAHARLYSFRADPPTTTMQRIKGFTTGSLPTFIDLGNNFASTAILEDNIIHQLGNIGKRLVFMGDDTWENLFPNKFQRSLPFPSFNVKDLHTVDNGILQHLYSTMVGEDWDVLVAHFLGVDHCGHRFGPDHPAMGQKLTQMDGVIRSVMERLQNDTLLVVMGDHGMTDTGDHGGESQKETDAALFLYSPTPLFPGPPSQSEPEVVPQTDLVPTLSLLLGAPIPYSNVGQVLLPLFPAEGQTEGAVTGLSQLEALWVNVKQVNRFLETYSSMARDIPSESLAALRDHFSRLSATYLASSPASSPASTRELVESMQAYLSSVRETCRATWARFNPLKMAAGLAVLALACLLCFLVSQASGALAAGGRGLLTVPLKDPVFDSLRCASLLSDSYVIAEGRVVTFLLLSLGLFVPVRLNWEGRLLPPLHDPQKPPAGLLPPAPPPAAVRRESYVLLGCLGLLVGGAYLSSCFHACREEQGACQPSPFLAPLARLQDSRRKNLQYVMSLAALGLWTYLLRRWLRHYGNLNASGGAVLAARWVLPLVAVCLGLHWAVSGTPEDSFRNLAELIGVAQVALPRAAFALLGLGMALLWADPITVFLKTRGPAPGRGSHAAAIPPLPPRYRASTGISPHAELQHLIPQIYQRMRRSLEDSEQMGAGEVDTRPAVEAYGLGTGMAMSFLLLLLEMGALLHIHASATSLAGLQGAHSGDFSVPWTPVVLWSLASSQFFHATGHLATFPSIQWAAAFVGFPGGHAGTLLPASLVALNTFSSHILFGVACPLLLFWPLVCEDDAEDAVMEMRLRENPQQFSSALLQLSTRYLTILGAQVLASVCAAAVLRRHLMVWKVFTPKLMFEASGFLVSSVSLLVGVSLVMRVDLAVGRWFRRLLPDATR
ncbi:hypothetical protein NHX12_027769 [Muraenolepis orangiensis]|uniref:GPI ethanolamine phosphate transferase 3, catalytic subunit n=1 Tax=Muraenolepis orangiensis TaxID=630683 RepID=A0A9Q0IPJ8_9TELE|nr:hypothetical protein NHX12_027769 [Muraenolepis orangiensis]